MKKTSTTGEHSDENQTLRLAEVTRRAVISPCEKYRWTLQREWDTSLPAVMFLMLNPSTADFEKDDATIRRCIAFAKSWGYGTLIVGNLFAFRSRHPKDLLTAADPIGGSENASWNEIAADVCELVVCAWGNSPVINALQKRFGKTYQPLSGLGKLHYLELSKDGTPKHPLYLKGDCKPIPYEVRLNDCLL